MTTQDTINQAWDNLLELEVSEQTLLIVARINGFNLEAMESILYAHTGYRSFDQLALEEA